MPRAPAAALLMCSCLSLMTARAQEKPGDQSREPVAKALKWLASKQNDDGSWSDERYSHDPAITALALQAFLAQGGRPNQGDHAETVAKGREFLLSAQREDGFIVGARGGNMYGHGLATLTLAQIHQLERNDGTKKALTKAAGLIVQCQGKEGGWRYNPEPIGGDISITVCQLLALKAVKDAGIEVPERTLESALEYAKRCYYPKLGAFRYQPLTASTSASFSRTAMGVCCLQSSKDEYQNEISECLKFMKKSMTGEHSYFWFAHYYGCQAMHRIGGQDWDDYRNKMDELLLKHQREDGSWGQIVDRSVERSFEDRIGPAFRTSIAVYVLSKPPSPKKP